MADGNAMIVVHGGAGSPSANSDGCEAAVRLGLAALNTADNALDGAIRSVVALEDDGRFNAGHGSNFCLDGVTIEMDAAVMDSTGSLGAVACLQRVRNPVLVARAVSETPHWLLVGEGAERFARVSGFAEYYAPSPKAQESYRRIIEGMQVRSDKDPAAPFKLHWNYALPWEEAIRRHGSGTVGAVVRDGRGNFAVATSTGGCAPSLLGRVGDTPIVGCGFFAGPRGAVAATGIGEYIVRQILARTVYQWIEHGVPLQAALDRGVALFTDEIDVGLIAVSETEAAASCNRDMATAFLAR
jgi:L-asparaginase/beta-aspartyl-peptidase (threonine type)